jgi:short subunit dehydrogenase-like uncharacterized protein
VTGNRERHIVCFGATGFTGELVVRALVHRRVRPVLAGRDEDRLARLAQECGGLDIAVADASDPESIRTLVGPDDVLVATVGPFLRFGWPAVSAACAAGAAYLDSTGEPEFIRRVVTELGSEAEATGARLVPAFGYDFVPGNLAGALALRDAPDAVAVRIGYFVRGRGAGISGGTAASAAGVLLQPGYVWRDGHLHQARPGAQMHTFAAANRQRQAVSVAGSEHLFLPELFPALSDVDVYLGWAGRYSPLVYAASPLAAGVLRIPGTASLVREVVRRFVPGSTGGPDAERRAASRSLVVAEALDPGGSVLVRVIVEGPDPYDLTAELLAWGAVRAAQAGMSRPGVLGPVQAFGLEALEKAAADIGIQRTT